MPPLVYAVTLNWNRPHDTIECLESLSQQSYPHLKLLVVDNGSTDDSVQLIRGAFPGVEVVENGRNLGFAAGMNAGIRAALARGADYVLGINNDTLLAADMLERLMTQCSVGVGLLAPIIYYADAPDIIWSVGGHFNQWTLEAPEKWRGQHDPGNLPACLEIDFVPGCAMLWPRTVLETVGLFDETFFMYYEDIDLCQRIRRAGFHIQTVPSAKLWHKVSLSSGGTDSPNERYWMARSSLVYFRKHARWWQRPFIIFWRAGSAVRTSWRLRHRRDSLQAYWRGLWHGLTA